MRLFIPITVVLLVGSLAALTMPSPVSPPLQPGVTFSAPYAASLGLDWQDTYQALLTDLGVKNVRLMAYWSVLEPTPDTYDFTALDYQMDEAAKHDAQVILALGRKLPRWPECHIPAWALSLPEAAQQEHIYQLIEKVVTRYRHHPALAMWQLENEPFLDYGDCPPADPAFLRQEEKLVRQLDQRPVLLTDSGELNWWFTVSQYGDVVGTTMYRTVYSSRTGKLWRYDYLFPAWLYRAKARLIKIVRGKDVIIAELQGEPWGSRPLVQLSRAEREASLSVERLATIARFAARTQLPAAYWWGAEYWYWEKVVEHNPAYWEQARTFFIP